MPTIHQLLEATTPVLIERGNIKFTLEAALELFTPDEGEFHKLLEAESELEITRDNIQAEKNSLLRRMAETGDLEALRDELHVLRTEERAQEAEKAESAADKKRILKRRIMVSDAEVTAEVTARLSALESEVDALEEKKKANALAIKRAQAKQLAYLVAGSDITLDDKGTPALSGVVTKTEAQLEADTELFFKTLSPALLKHCLEKVEGAVFAPLATTG